MFWRLFQIGIDPVIWKADNDKTDASQPNPTYDTHAYYQFSQQDIVHYIEITDKTLCCSKNAGVIILDKCEVFCY